MEKVMGYRGQARPINTMGKTGSRQSSGKLRLQKGQLFQNSEKED
jgi:hypothetical protein